MMWQQKHFDDHSFVFFCFAFLDLFLDLVLPYVVLAEKSSRKQFCLVVLRGLICERLALAMLHGIKLCLKKYLIRKSLFRRKTKEDRL